MTTPAEVDVVITGAGVGAAMLALSLGRAGVRVLMAEPGPGIPTRGADVLKARGIRVLRDHGLLPALLATGAACRDVIRYYHDGQPLLTLDFTEHTDVGYYLVAPYRTIAEVLLEACAAHPSITVAFNSAVDRIDTETGTGHAVYLHSGQTVHAAVVIGADGPRSPVLAHLGAELTARPYGHRLRVATLATSWADLLGGRLYFSSSASFAYLYPIDARTARVFVGLPADLDETLGPEPGARLVEHLSFFVPDPAHLPLLAAAGWQPVPIGSWQAPHLVRGGAAVLGHAAFSTHPMTGLGMSVTLEDATILAQAIIDALRAGRLADELLARRYAPRHDLHRRLISYGDALAASYPNAATYLRRFQPRLHGGDR